MMQVLVYLAIAAALFAAGYGVGAERTSAKVAEAALTHQQQQFEVDRKADQDAARTNIAAAVVAAKAGDRTNDILAAVNASSHSIMERVNNATRSNLCINSPAIRAYIDGLRAEYRRTNKNSVSHTAAN